MWSYPKSLSGQVIISLKQPITKFTRVNSLGVDSDQVEPKQSGSKKERKCDRPA